MALFRPARPAPGRLFLTRADGRSLRREVPAEHLHGFAERVLARGGAEVQGIWSRAGQAGSDAVRECWPESLPLPERAMLGAGDAKSGPWLEVCYPRGAALTEIAEDLARCLAGVGIAERIVPEPVAAPTPRPQPRVPPATTAVAPKPAPPAPAPRAHAPQPTAPPIPAPRPPEPRPAPAPVEAPPRPPAAHPPVSPPPRIAEPPEVLPPGARLAPPHPSVIRPHADDVFGVWGPEHPDDTEGDSPDLRAEDLPWLCPGDRLYSPRRGNCKLLALEDAQGRWRLRDERGRELEVTASELTAEFSFDDEPRGA
jgi:hypothetical protein